MKANELMVGDWVKLMNPKGECIDYVKIDTNLFGIFLRDGEEGFVRFEPIPLTEEILEKNGFVKHDKIHPYYMDYYHERDGFTIFNSRTWYGHILNSVHELQHALRLCGLNDLADNFKVN